MVKIIAATSKIPPTVELIIKWSVVDSYNVISIRKYKKRHQRRKLRLFRGQPEIRSLKSSSMITMYVNVC